jgi:regulator of replication initiation timing
MKKANQTAKSMQMLQKFEVVEVNHYKKVSFGNISSSLLYGDDSSDESIEKLPKIKELLLKNLSKHCTQQIQKHFSKWKISSVIMASQKLYTMISILNRIFLNKGKRVFQPPRIIKDADEIMTRTIKKIIQIKNRLLDSAFFRWRLFRTALHTKEKAVVFYRACQMAGHNFRDAFYNWREKTLARESIKRTAATQMMQRILSKCFRGRFKVFVFKTYMRVGVKQAVGRIFTLLSQKYIENNRLSFRMWKEMFNAWEIQGGQVYKDACFYKMIEIWKRIVKIKLQSGFGKFMKDNRLLKTRLIRTLISSYKGKKYRCWVTWTRASNNFKTKFQALKMATALKRAARKSQKFGFRIFLSKNPNTNKLQFKLSKLPIKTLKQAFKHILSSESRVKTALRVFFSKMEKPVSLALSSWKHYKDQVHEKKLLTALKAQKLRFSLSKILSSTLKNAFNRLVTSENRVKSAIRRVIQNILKRPKTTFYIWKSYIQLCKSQIVLDNYKTSKLKSTLFRISSRVLRCTFDRIIGEGDLVKGALKKIVQCLGKKKTCAWNNWKIFDFKCKNRDIMTNVQSLKLKSKLIGVCLRTERCSFKRIANGGDAVKEALQNVITKILIKRQKYFKCWKKNYYGCLNREKNVRSISHIFRCKLQKTLWMWKDFAHCLTHERVLIVFKGQKLQHSIQKIVRKRLQLVKAQILCWSNQIELKLTLLSLKYYRKPKVVFRTWKDYVYNVKKGKLLDSMRTEKLKNAISKITFRTLTSVTRTILLLPGLIKKSFRIFLQNRRDNCKKTLTSWSRYVHKCKQGQLLDAVRTQKLRKHLSDINRRQLRDAVERVLGDGSKVKGSLRRMMLQVHKCKMLSLQKWKYWFMRAKAQEAAKKIKGYQLQTILRKVPERTLRSAIDRIIGNGARAIGAVRRMMSHLKTRCGNAFQVWKDFLSQIKERDLKRAIILKSLVDLIIQRTSRIMIDSILGDCRVRRLLNKLVNNYKSIEKTAFDQMWGRVEKVRTIRKINSAYFVFKSFVSMAKKIVATKFVYWKNLEFLRRRRIMRKAMGKIIQTISISYEIGYWRWKFVLSRTGTQLNPKHSLFFKRLFVLASNYMRRLEQFALFKIVLNYKAHPMTTKLSLPKALANLLKTSTENDSNIQTLDTKALNTESAFEDFYGNLSTVPPSGIRKDEILRVKQKGAAQVIYMYLQQVLYRKISLGLIFIDAYACCHSNTDEEKCLILEQINELKYEKHSLLEDNNTLRIHNDSLIARLEKNTVELEEISLNLDMDKISNMVKTIQHQMKLVTCGAFYCIGAYNN